MSSLFSKLPFTESGRMTGAVLGVSLIAVGIAIYLSPSGGHSSKNANALAPKTETATATAPRSTTTATAARPKPKTSFHVVKAPPATDVVVVKTPGPGTTATRTAHSTTTRTRTKYSTTTTSPKRLYCSDFTYQQDAQAVYVANLSDPWGLDGAPGPHNGDGIACRQLPDDPSRSPSEAVDAYVPPTPASKSELIKPAKRYFGVAEDGLPGDTSLYNKIATKTGKAPSSVEWFSYWSSGYDAAKVQQSWSHGALPIISWMSVAANSKSPGASTYTLANIVNGTFDDYLTKYAGSVLATGLPVVIRFDHEMNGNWYPWSAGMPANQSSGGPNLYVQAWQHVWNVFDRVGANADVIWMWSPSRVDSLVPHSTQSGLKYETTLAEDYPGTQYVDWVGMSAYQYKPTDGWTYENTFRNTINGLNALTSSGKPIFVAETGATQAVGNVQYSQEKAQWTSQTLAGLAVEPNVVGFSWFNNNVEDVHEVDGTSIATNWQLDSSPPALAAFVTGIANPAYASGIMPDAAGG